MLALRLEDIIVKKAKERQSQAGKEKLPLKSAEAVDTREELAKIAGVGHDTIHKVRTIIREAKKKAKRKRRD